MRISVIDPISPAIERTKLVLFQPFDVGKWFTLGFCAFLAALGEGGGFTNGSFNYRGGGGGGEDGPKFESAKNWFLEHLVIILAIAAAIFLFLCLLGLVLTWLNSRGKFMFIDGIVKNRGAVAEPWGEYRQEGNSLFWFRFWFNLGCFVVFVLLVGLCALIALPSIRAEEFGQSAVIALLVGVPLMILFAITTGLVTMFLIHFVVPIMYLRRVGVMAAWREFRHEILAGHVGTFILYVLFQIIMNMAIGLIALVAICLTCCLAALPYLSSVILLPLLVFVRSYHLYFLQQFGPTWTFFKDKPPPQTSPFAADTTPP